VAVTREIFAGRNSAWNEVLRLAAVRVTIRNAEGEIILRNKFSLVLVVLTVMNEILLSSFVL
jgi:hypothetical protein